MPLLHERGRCEPPTLMVTTRIGRRFGWIVDMVLTTYAGGVYSAAQIPLGGITRPREVGSEEKGEGDANDGVRGRGRVEDAGGRLAGGHGGGARGRLLGRPALGQRTRPPHTEDGPREGGQ